MAKMDYQISDKNSLFGRYMSGNLSQSSTYDGKNPLSINTGLVHDLDYGFTLGDTYLFSPTLVNSLRVGGNRANVVTISEDNYGSWASFGANVDPLGQNYHLQSRRPAPSRSAAGPHLERGLHSGPLWSVFDDVSLIKGSHQIGFGGSIFSKG